MTLLIYKIYLIVTSSLTTYFASMYWNVPDDGRAVRELFRVIKPAGNAYISVPMFDIEDTLEDSAYNTDELRLKHYGQHDHVRKYSKRAFPKLLKEAGFDVVGVKLNQGIPDSNLKRFGLLRDDTVFLCTKP